MKENLNENFTDRYPIGVGHCASSCDLDTPAKDVDVTFPTCWDELSVKQLEQLANLYTRQLPKPQFCLLAYLYLAKLRLLQTFSGDAISGITYYVRRKGFLHWLLRERIPFTGMELAYWSRNALAFLFEDCDRIIFPYPFMRLRGLRFRGPSELCQDFSWRQFKWASDYLTLYRDESVVLLDLARSGAKKDEIKKQTRVVRSARNLFLATIFTPRKRVVNPETHRIETVYRFETGQAARYHRRFNSVSDIRFRCILFFWDGLSHYLHNAFPLIYKEEGAATVDALKAEAQITETLKRRSNLTTEEVYAEPYTHILETLERLASEAKEIEKLRTK